MDATMELRLYEEMMVVLHEQQRPSARFKPTLTKNETPGNGENYRAWYGAVCGGGTTPNEAMLDFDKRWHQTLEQNLKVEVVK